MRVVLISQSSGAVASNVRLLHELGHETVGVLTVRNRRRPEAVAEIVDATPAGLDVVVVGSKERVTPLLRSYEADLGLCNGFAWKLDAEALAALPLGVVNGHPSLLPQWRGPNPFGWTLRSGAEEVGFTYHLMDEGLDTGPILAQGSAPLPAGASIADLFAQLPALAEALLRKALVRIEAGDRGDPQTEEGASYAGLYEDEYAEVDWTQRARDVHRQLSCWFLPTVSGIMGPLTTVDGERVRVLESALADAESHEAPGTILERDAEGGFLVVCGDGATIRVLRTERVS
jgi:methionyl-tRNA formyltransferase